MHIALFQTHNWEKSSFFQRPPTCIRTDIHIYGHMGQIGLMRQFFSFYWTQVRSLSVTHSVSKCAFSMLLHVFVYAVICIFKGSHIYLSKLLHVFVKFVICTSCPLCVIPLLRGSCRCISFFWDDTGRIFGGFKT